LPVQFNFSSLIQVSTRCKKNKKTKKLKKTLIFIFHQIWIWWSTWYPEDQDENETFQQRLEVHCTEWQDTQRQTKYKNSLEQEIQENFGFQSSEPTKMEVVDCKNFIHWNIKRTLPPSFSWDRFLRDRGGKIIPQFIYDSRNERREPKKYHWGTYLDVDSSQESAQTL
jgi:hypothetical protein